MCLLRLRNRQHGQQQTHQLGQAMGGVSRDFTYMGMWVCTVHYQNGVYVRQCWSIFVVDVGRWPRLSVYIAIFKFEISLRNVACEECVCCPNMCVNN